MLDQKKIVTWALIILFLSLGVVYSLAYMRKTAIFKPSISTTPVVQMNESNVDSGSEGGENISNVDDQIPTVNVGDNQFEGETFSDIQPKEEKPDLASTGSATPSVIQLLPGTTQYLETLDIIDVLGVLPDYILQDDRGNYFASYGVKGLDFVRTVQNLGGNVYVMNTEAEILKNELFGDKVSYINMAAFQDKLILMVIEIEGDTWLIQVPASKYYSSKAYLKSLFM
ncbi:hypothetical protein AGMMS50249_7800 [candidate division SR1 bacterium]|nr:hypothetical protein AGMMS50249_7800 [candidate division SR1 bacterium]